MTRMRRTALSRRPLGSTAITSSRAVSGLRRRASRRRALRPSLIRARLGRREPRRVRRASATVRGRSAVPAGPGWRSRSAVSSTADTRAPAGALTRIGSLYRIAPSPAPVAQRLASARTPFLSSPVMVRDFIVAGSADGVLFGFTLEGRIAWRVLIAGPIELSPLVLSDGFLAFGGRGDLHRYRL